MSLQVTYRYGNISSSSGAQPFFWDRSNWDMMNWDVITSLAGGITERVAVGVSLAGTGLNLPFNLTYVVVTSG